MPATPRRRVFAVFNLFIESLAYMIVTAGAGDTLGTATPDPWPFSSPSPSSSSSESTSAKYSSLSQLLLSDRVPGVPGVLTLPPAL
eukprot:2447390-Rhodomonas_salina.3